MSNISGAIETVRDTALLVAACRAIENQKPDAFVRDPFAARLAGARGIAIVGALSQPNMAEFGIAIRTRLIDELLLEVLAAEEISTVLSLGCGLDTRLWRLEVPAEVRWIEVDFAAMLDYKESLMLGEIPQCARERFVADLNDPAQRHAVYRAVGPGRALILPKGC